MEAANCPLMTVKNIIQGISLKLCRPYHGQMMTTIWNDWMLIFIGSLFDLHKSESMSFNPHFNIKNDIL